MTLKSNGQKCIQRQYNKKAKIYHERNTKNIYASQFNNSANTCLLYNRTASYLLK